MVSALRVVWYHSADLDNVSDYGESHYVGPIEGAQPGSNAWVDGFDHSPWLDMAAPYISTFKTGAWRPLQRDELYMWSRPHPHLADAPGDGLGKPLGWNWVRYLRVRTRVEVSPDCF
jgi:glucan endo-1,3-alpha-glucosidase